ncbi:Exocyst complex component SEC5 [Nakaseomyces bracarensis]|uniref:Exocyst complex component SEC5 n=1 Tax=Nakaseomyces bracarensis TaxID=273131 RepID=A0ABR4NTA8_9SACH
MGFEVEAEKMLELYNLRQLDIRDDSQNDWAAVSAVQYDLSGWQESKKLEEKPYELLSELIEQQKQLQEQKHAGRGDTDRARAELGIEEVSDPLDGQLMLHKLQILQVGQEQAPQHLINNKNFDAIMFLRTVHNRDTFEDLARYLDSLDRDLQLQSRDLQQLVEGNFTRYVKIKSRLDQIYESFYEGDAEKNQNELEVEQLKEKLDETIRFTTQKLNPVINNDKKITNYKLTKKFIEENRFFVDLPKRLKQHLLNHDYNTLIKDYLKGKEQYDKFVEHYKEKLTVPDLTANDGHTSVNQTPRVIEMIWKKCKSIIENYKNQLWRLVTEPQLIEAQDSLFVQYNPQSKSSHEFNFTVEPPEVFLPIISRLLDLDIEENTILKWIYSRMDYLEEKLRESSKNMISKITLAQESILRNQSASAKENERDTDAVELGYYINIEKLFKPVSFNKDNRNEEEVTSNSNLNLSSSIITGNAVSQGLTDSPIVVSMWLLIMKYVHQISEISAKFIQLWEHTEKFLDGSYQATLINEKRKENILLIGDFNASEKYQSQIKLSDDEIRGIRMKGEKFVNLVAEKLFILFQSSQSNLSQFSSEDITMDEITWEKEIGLPSNYGFIPPNANGLSCLRYLPLIIEPILKFNTDLAQLKITPSAIDIPRKLVSVIIGRSVSAISSTKLRDIANFHKLENWEEYEVVTNRSEDFNATQYEFSVTQFPNIIRSFQELSIKTIRDIVFSFEKLPTVSGVSIIEYPSKKVLTGIEIQQIISLEAVLESILKNAAKDKDNPRNPHTILTLTNLQYIRETTFPMVLQFFDDCFEWNLASKNLELFNLLSKMEQSIFGNYLSDLKISLRDTLESKFHEIDWATYTSTSFRAGDYVIESLMVLVTVHSECSRVGPQLIDRILRESHIFISRYLYESFKPFIGNMSADGLLQVTVDIQFFQRVLGRLLDKDTEATLTATLQNCFQNDIDRMQRCIKETEPIVTSNLKRTSIQFSAFK